jgi:hypothetical protein
MFYDRFAANMALLSMRAPRSLFESATTTIASIALIARGIRELGPGATMGDIFRTIPPITSVAVGATVAAEITAGVGAVLATIYLSAVIGSLLVATGQTLGIDRFFVVAHEQRLPAGWVLPAFTETSGRLIAATRGSR